MDRAGFLEKIEAELKAAPGSVGEDDRLEDLDGWDSIGALSVIAMIDSDYGVTLDAGAFTKCETVAELASLVEEEAESA